MGPKAPEETPESVNDSGGIDWDAELAQGESSWRQRLGMTDPPPQQAADTETVALQQGYGEEGGDGVEGNRAPNIDESQAGTDGASENAGVLRNVAFLVDLGDPAGEGEPFVTGEGPEIASDSGEV